MRKIKRKRLFLWSSQADEQTIHTHTHTWKSNLGKSQFYGRFSPVAGFDETMRIYFFLSSSFLWILFWFQCRLRRCCRREMMRFISISVLRWIFFVAFLFLSLSYIFTIMTANTEQSTAVCVRAGRFAWKQFFTTDNSKIIGVDGDGDSNKRLRQHNTSECESPSRIEMRTRNRCWRRPTTSRHDWFCRRSRHTPIYLMTCIFVSHFFNCSVFIPFFALVFLFLSRSLSVPAHVSRAAFDGNKRKHSHCSRNTHTYTRSRTKNPEKRRKRKKKKRIKFMNERNYMKLFRKLSDNETRAHTYGITRWQRTSDMADGRWTQMEGERGGEWGNSVHICYLLTLSMLTYSRWHFAIVVDIHRFATHEFDRKTHSPWNEITVIARVVAGSTVWMRVWQPICVANIHFKCKFVHWLVAIAAIRAYVSAEKSSTPEHWAKIAVGDKETKMAIRVAFVRSNKTEEWYSVIADDDCEMDFRGIPRLDAFTIPVIMLNDIEMSLSFYGATKGISTQAPSHSLALLRFNANVCFTPNFRLIFAILFRTRVRWRQVFLRRRYQI